MQRRHLGRQAAKRRRDGVELHLQDVLARLADVVHHVVRAVDAEHERLASGDSDGDHAT